jgi:hypothetical protein
VETSLRSLMGRNSLRNSVQLTFKDVSCGHKALQFYCWITITRSLGLGYFSLLNSRVVDEKVKIESHVMVMIIMMKLGDE